MGPGGGSLEEMYRTAYAFGMPFAAAGVGLVVMGSAYAAPLVVPPAVVASEKLAVSAFYQVTRPHWWAAYNAYIEADDLYHWSHGDPMNFEPDIRVRPYVLPGGVPIGVPFPWLNLRASHPEVAGLETPQSPPPLHQGNKPHRPSPSVAAPRPTWGTKSSSKTTRSRKRCPPGHYWNGRRCVKR